MHERDKKFDALGVPYQAARGDSLYFRDPDGARLELLANPLGEMYANPVLSMDGCFVILVVAADARLHAVFGGASARGAWFHTCSVAHRAW